MEVSANCLLLALSVLPALTVHGHANDQMFVVKYIAISHDITRVLSLYVLFLFCSVVVVAVVRACVRACVSACVRACELHPWSFELTGTVSKLRYPVVTATNHNVF